MNECEYPAEDIYDLGEHMHEFHGEMKRETLDCYFCDQSFNTKRDLMIHRKKEHIEKVKTCSYFLQQRCNYGDNCWYVHKKEDLELVIKCNLCDSLFRYKDELMHHRKKQHSEHVKHCIDSSGGKCKFGKTKCWFLHTE